MHSLILFGELEINKLQSTNIYEHCKNVNHNTLLKRHSNDFSRYFGISVCWLTKLNKNPTKARFIIAAPACSVKLLSKYITSVFKLIFNQVNSYNKQWSYFSDVNSFWSILNNQPVTDALNKGDSRGKATSISCFDFSTLHTKIPFDKLLKVFNELIDFCFKGGNDEFISVYGHGAKWEKERRLGFVVFTKNNLKKAVNYLLQNCCFKLRNMIFRQTIGVPMVLDPAPFFANHFFVSTLI